MTKFNMLSTNLLWDEYFCLNHLGVLENIGNVKDKLNYIISHRLKFKTTKNLPGETSVCTLYFE